MDYKVCIIVPVFNGEKYITDCVRSLNRQTLSKIELIFVNDGSTDRSAEILTAASKRQSNIKVIHQANKGPAAARKAGIDEASAKYIGFIDIDDTLDPTMFEKMHKIAISSDADIVVCGILEIQGGGRQTMLTFDFDEGTVFEKSEIVKHILRPVLKNGGGLYASMCNKIYKSSLIKYDIEAGSYRNYGEDWFFNQVALGRAEKIAFLKEPLYHYWRVNPNSIMSSYRQDLFNLHLDSRAFLKERMAEWGLNSKNDQFNTNTRFCEKVFEAIVNEMSIRNPISTIEKLINVNNIVSNNEVQLAARNAAKNFISYCLVKRYSVFLILYAWYLAVLKPVLYKFKVVIIKE